MEKLLEAFKFVYSGTVNKCELEFKNFSVTMYRVGKIIRLDIKEKDN